MDKGVLKCQIALGLFFKKMGGNSGKGSPEMPDCFGVILFYFLGGPPLEKGVLDFEMAFCFFLSFFDGNPWKRESFS